jgi:hypothetical protein
MPGVPQDPLGTGIYQLDYSPNSELSSFVLKGVLELSNNPALGTDVDGVQTQFSNIDCADPAYCLKL